MTGPITWEAVLTLIVVFGAGGGVWWRIHLQIEKARTEARLKAEAVQLLVAEHARTLAEFKIEVARSYATQQSITQVEERVVQAIERLGDRLDRFLEDRNRR